MMGSRELIDALIRNKPADRVGFFDNPWGDTVKKWVAEGYPTDDDGNALPVDSHFGFDMTGAGGWFDFLPIRGHEEIVEENDEWVVKKNGAGASLKWWKEKSGTPEHIDFTMTSREIWERDYRPHLLEVDPKRIDLEEHRWNLNEKTKQGFWTSYGHMFIWENMRRSMGDICLYESLVLDPEWVHDYNRVNTDLYKGLYKLLFDEVGLPNGIWMYEDLGYKQRTFCSPDILRDLIFPYYKEMVDFFHSYDLPVVLHTCGFVESIVDQIVDAGFDALNPMEAKAGNDTLRIADKWGDQLAFIGGLDARVLESGDRDLIKRSVTNLVVGMKKRGARYVFGSDHSLSTNVAYEDFKYAVDVYRDNMMY